MGCPNGLRITDFDANQPGSPDTAEFVELTNIGPADASLAGYSLVFFDAATEASYFALDLHGSLAPGASFLIGNPGVAGAGQSFPDNTLQNGPDALAVLNLPAASVSEGTPATAVSAPFPGSVIASIIYLNDEVIFAQYPAAGSKAGEEPRDLQALLAAARDAEAEAVPEHFALEQNYPNPFNPQTAIRFALPEAAPVRLSVYDVLGREVQRLVDGQREAGWHEAAWDGRGTSGAPVASGVYVYRIEAGAYVQTRRMLLLK